MGLTIGGTVAYQRHMGTEHGFSPGIELSVFKEVDRPWFLWTTLGNRWSVTERDTGVIPYLELGVNALLFNLGAGWGIGTSSLPRHHLQVFGGLSIPFLPTGRHRLMFVQLYYRPVFFPGGNARPAHEMGIMLKRLFIIRHNR